MQHGNEERRLGKMRRIEPFSGSCNSHSILSFVSRFCLVPASVAKTRTCAGHSIHPPRPPVSRLANPTDDRRRRPRPSPPAREGSNWSCHSTGSTSSPSRPFRMRRWTKKASCRVGCSTVTRLSALSPFASTIEDNFSLTWGSCYFPKLDDLTRAAFSAVATWAMPPDNARTAVARAPR